MKEVSIANNEIIIENYKNFLELGDIKPATIEIKLYVLVPFFRFLNFKKADEITRQDVEAYFIYLKRSKKKKSTQLRDFITIKSFFKWFKPGNDFFTNINVKKAKPDTTDKEYVTVDDVKKMLKYCTSLRDRVLVMLLWESGARLGELLSLNLQDLKPQKYGLTIAVTGKTGRRDILIIDAVPDVQAWLNIYRPESQEAPLFPTLRNKNRLQNRGAQAIIKKLAKQAGIKKRIWCHGFRHGRLTELSNAGLSEMQLRLYAGWTNESEMPAVYLHPTKEDVFNKLLNLKGIKTDEIKKDTIKELSVKKCPRCNTENAFDAKYCKSCSLILDQMTAVDYEKDMVEIDMEIMKAITLDPQVLTILAEKMEKYRQNKE